MKRLNLWLWFKGSRPTFWGRFYRGGVLFFGMLAFLASWWMATVSLGGLGFMLGWLPCIIIAVIAGFAWPLIVTAGSVTAGALLYMQWSASQPKPNSWHQDVTIATAEDRLAKFREAVCSNLPNRFSLYRPAFADPATVTPEEKEQMRAFIISIAEHRAALDRIRKTCTAEPG